jgi:N-acyl-D-amino-acid deacylase
LAEGTDTLVRDLQDGAYRQRIYEEFTKGLDVWHKRQILVGWDNIVISGVTRPENKWMEGQDCLTSVQKLDKNPMCDLLAEENLAVTMISRYGSPQILEKFLTHSQGTAGFEGVYCGRSHPRLYGTYPRFIREFVKEKEALNLPEAIYKITVLPANIRGLNSYP